MQGIYFGKSILGIYFCIIFFYYFKKDDYKKPVDRANGETQSNKDAGLKKIIKQIVAISASVYLVYVVATGKQSIVHTVIMSIFALIIFMIMLYTIIEFVKYIFLRNDNYKFDDGQEHIFAFTALICFLACSFIERISINNDYFISVIMQDFVKMLTCSYWYSCVIFFPTSLLLIIGYKRLQYKRESAIKEKPEGLCINDLKLKRLKAKSNDESTCDRYSLKCIICKLYDSLLSCTIDGMEAAIKIVLVSISIPYTVVVKTKKWIERKMIADLSKNLIICSRFSLVAGLMIVFVIDKYYSLFSDAGSSVFEFSCSVIIIPLLITQLAALREKSV